MKRFFIIIIVVGSLFTTTITASNQIIDVNDRSVFTYELLDLKLSSDKLYLKGWGLILKNQNLYGSHTHQFSIELQQDGQIIKVPTKLINTSLTRDKQYDGYPPCKDSEYFNPKCNYKYENVGFEANIPLSLFKSDGMYEIYLVMKTHQTGKTYRTPLYYAQEKYLETSYQGRKVYLDASFDKMAFSVFSSTLRVVSTPAHSMTGNHMALGPSCSKAYSNRLFYKHQSSFYKPISKSLYNGLITYYKVGIKLDECIDQRRRVLEGGKDIISYIPSTYINYKGKPLTLTILSHSKPILSAEDHLVEQYSDYEPLRYASAYDKEEGNISKNIKVTKTDVNTRFPGNYTSCYEVSNKYQMRDQKCVKVTVVPIQTKIRYINQKSYPKANLQLWGITEFKTFLLTLLDK